MDFIREVVKTPGTKALCREGGCGVCIVVATMPDRESPGHTKTISVQAVGWMGAWYGGSCMQISLLKFRQTKKKKIVLQELYFDFLKVAKGSCSRRICVGKLEDPNIFYGHSGYSLMVGWPAADALVFILL